MLDWPNRTAPLILSFALAGLGIAHFEMPAWPGDGSRGCACEAYDVDAGVGHTCLDGELELLRWADPEAPDIRACGRIHCRAADRRN
jgi:hypothetical protein